MPRLLFVGKCRRPRAYCYADENESLKREGIVTEEEGNKGAKSLGGQEGMAFGAQRRDCLWSCEALFLPHKEGIKRRWAQTQLGFRSWCWEDEAISF